MKIFKLPDLGEGLPDAEISEWHVKIGDIIKLDQNLVAMETAKAVVEVPSPIAGRVVKLYGEPGDVIKTGAPLVEFEHMGSESESKSSKEQDSADPTLNDRVNNAATVAGKIEVGNFVIPDQALLNRTQGSLASNAVKASPAVRALASQWQVNLATVHPTGPNGLITRQDVEQAAKQLEGAGELEPLKGVRRAMAQVMSLAHAEVVPVTVMDDAKLLNWSLQEDITVRIIEAIVSACRAEPALNAWFDSKNVARRLMKEVQLGLAMDTPDGLFVPVIRGAENKNKQALRETIEGLKKQVHDRTIPADDLRHATFTLSNFGKFAGRYANPIVVPPMVGILGVGRLREEATVVKGEIKIAKILPLALTFDHRAVTGGEATRFLGQVIQALEV